MSPNWLAVDGAVASFAFQAGYGPAQARDFVFLTQKLTPMDKLLTNAKLTTAFATFLPLIRDPVCLCTIDRTGTKSTVKPDQLTYKPIHAGDMRGSSGEPHPGEFTT